MFTRSVALITVAALAAGGCSMSLPAAGDIRSRKVETCATETARPSKDVFWVVAGAALALGGPVAAQSINDGGSAGDAYTRRSALYFFVPGGLIAAIAGYSAIHGFRSVRACREHGQSNGETITASRSPLASTTSE